MDRFNEGHLAACLEIRTLLQAAANRRSSPDFDQERDAWTAAIEIADKHGNRPAQDNATLAQEDALRPGDVAQLKSGGPAMTIDSAYDTSAQVWTCVWFDGPRRIRGDFSAAVLRRVDAPAQPAATSSEPDAWQEEPERLSDLPIGFEAIGPWTPTFSVFHDEKAWRRPLRKVAP